MTLCQETHKPEGALCGLSATQALNWQSFGSLF